MKKTYKKLSKHAQNEWTILEGKNVHSGPATKVQVSVKILQNFLYLKIKMFPTESNLCRFSTEWIIWKILLKFTKKKPVGKSSQVKLEAHAQTCHCHEPTLKHVTAMGDSFTKFHGTFFYSEPLRMTISPIISYAFM